MTNEQTDPKPVFCRDCAHYYHEGYRLCGFVAARKDLRGIRRRPPQGRGSQQRQQLPTLRGVLVGEDVRNPASMKKRRKAMKKRRKAKKQRPSLTERWVATFYKSFGV